jgi:hypothetical protein
MLVFANVAFFAKEMDHLILNHCFHELAHSGS